MSNQSEQNQQTQGQEQSGGAKKYILVAEDDKFYANIYKTKLTKEGYEVVVVGDGAQAMKLARQKKPDLILLDIVMPVKDGFETLRELKADANLKSVKVVVLSNLGQEEDIKKAKELGAQDYIVKANVSIQQMMSKIKSFIT